MWNLREWGVFIKKIIKGAVWGLVVGIALTIYGSVADTWNCFCNEISGGKFSLPAIENNQVPTFGLTICIALGMISGIVTATKSCKTRVKRQTQEREARNYAQVCGRLNLLTEAADNFSAILQQHKNNSGTVDGECNEDLLSNMEDCETLYNKLHQSYEDHTKVKGDA